VRFSAAALFPLALVGVLAAMSFWLERATTSGELDRKAKGRHAPDFIVEKFNVQRFDAGGALLQTLTAERMTHFPDTDSSEVVTPSLTYYRPEAPTYVSARMAELLQDGREVKLSGTVRISRPASASGPATLIQSEALTVFPDEERAVGNVPVTLTQGTNVVHGRTLTYYGRDRIAHLGGGVHGTFLRGQTQ